MVGDVDAVEGIVESGSKSVLSRIGFCFSLERLNRRVLRESSDVLAVGTGRDGDSQGEAEGEFEASSRSLSGCSSELSKNDSVDLMRLFLRDKMLFFHRIFFSFPLISFVTRADV